MIRWIICFILLAILCCSCGDDLLSDDETQGMRNEEIVETIMPVGNEKYLTEDSDYIFDQSKLPTFELNLPKSSLLKINGNPTAEEYVEGSITFEGETISPVGIRYKGSIGAFVGCLTGRDWANPSGAKTCTKLSMKVKINWEGRDEQFYGLKKLQFHSQNNDDSQMRERLGYWFYRQMGVPAPRSIHARLLINGEFAGLYALTEQIDGRFTRYNFDDGEGNLYKEVWPLTSGGAANNSAQYLNALKTNEDYNPSVALIESFGREISQSSDEEELIRQVEKWMDIDKIISYAVVDRTIRNDDGVFHWYCGGNSCSNHNFYWYEETDKSKLHLIPWDLDNAFENIISNANPVTPIADKWGQISNNCRPFSSGFLGITQRSAACDRLTYAWTLYDEEYKNRLREFKEGPMAQEVVRENIETWAAQIRDATIEASQAHGDAITISSWEKAMVDLLTNIDFTRQIQ